MTRLQTMKNLALALLFLFPILPSCSQAKTTFRMIQDFAEPYQVYVKGVEAGSPASYGTHTAFNSRFIALAGAADLQLEVHAAVLPGGGSAKIWERRIMLPSGHAVWELVIDEENQLRILPSTWEAARGSLKGLPEKVAGPNHAKADGAGEVYQLQLPNYQSSTN